MQRHAFEVQLPADSWPEPPDSRSVSPDVTVTAITATTLVVTGGLDMDHFQAIAAYLGAEIPQARLTSLDWAAHLPSLERPAETTSLGHRLPGEPVGEDMTDDEHASTVVHSSCRLAGDSDHDAQSAHHDAVLALEPAPFLEEWALIAGDCAHNTRTALDVFIWVNSTELPRSARGGVAYPILPFDPEFGEDDAEGCSDRLEDQSSSVRRSIERKIEGLPEPLRSRVLDNIRWSSLVEQGSPIWHQRLPLLQELDNVDKHRLALEVVPTRAMTCLDLRAWAPGGERLKIDYTSDVGRFLERAPNGERQVVASGTTRAPIARLTGKATQTLALRVRTLDLSQSLVETLEEHIDDAEGLLTVLASRDPAPPRPMNIS